MKKKCEETIEIMILDETEEIEYWCTHCPYNNGRVSGWQGTKQDNIKKEDTDKVLILIRKAY